VPVEGHADWPVPQLFTQAPAEHFWTLGQTTPQLPQLLLSVWKLTHD
jgi:hypothetical protein